MGIGYTPNFNEGGANAYADRIVVGSNSLGNGPYYNSSSLYLKNINGEWATDQTLIQWLLDNNAEIIGGIWDETAITDLTNTKWLLNSTITISEDINGSVFTLNFTSYSGEYTKLIPSIKSTPTGDAIQVDYGRDRDFVGTPPEYENGWSAEEYRTIEITGGTDTTNTNLISWLEQNATQIVETYTYILRVNGKILNTINGKQIRNFIYKGTTYEIVQPTPTVKIYGVDGIGAESYTLTRTDNNIGLTSSSQELHDFFVDNEDVTDANNNHFVALKKFYMKVTTNDDGSQKWQVSKEKVDDSYFLCPYFYDKDGNEIEIAYYGKYKGSVSSNILKSVTGVSPTYSTTGDNFRTYARNTSVDNYDYHQTDWATVLLAQCMFMIVYATTKYDSVFTMRYSGTNTGTNTQTFFGIEDMVSNGYEFVDGITYSNGTCYYKDFVGQYSGQITSGNSISGITTGNDYQKTKMNISGKPVSLIFPQTIGGSETTYLCDRFSGSTSSSSRSTWWGSDSANAYGGLFYLNCYYGWAPTLSYYGSRLHTKKLFSGGTHVGGSND